MQTTFIATINDVKNSTVGIGSDLRNDINKEHEEEINDVIENIRQTKEYDDNYLFGWAQECGVGYLYKRRIIGTDRQANSLFTNRHKFLGRFGTHELACKQKNVKKFTYYKRWFKINKTLIDPMTGFIKFRNTAGLNMGCVVDWLVNMTGVLTFPEYVLRSKGGDGGTETAMGEDLTTYQQRNDSTAFSAHELREKMIEDMMKEYRDADDERKKQIEEMVEEFMTRVDEKPETYKEERLLKVFKGRMRPLCGLLRFTPEELRYQANKTMQGKLPKDKYRLIRWRENLAIVDKISHVYHLLLGGDAGQPYYQTSIFDKPPKFNAKNIHKGRKRGDKIWAMARSKKLISLKDKKAKNSDKLLDFDIKDAIGNITGTYNTRSLLDPYGFNFKNTIPGKRNAIYYPKKVFDAIVIKDKLSVLHEMMGDRIGNQNKRLGKKASKKMYNESNLSQRLRYIWNKLEALEKDEDDEKWKKHLGTRYKPKPLMPVKITSLQHSNISNQIQFVAKFVNKMDKQVDKNKRDIERLKRKNSTKGANPADVAKAAGAAADIASKALEMSPMGFLKKFGMMIAVAVCFGMCIGNTVAIAAINKKINKLTVSERSYTYYFNAIAFDLYRDYVKRDGIYTRASPDVRCTVTNCTEKRYDYWGYPKDDNFNMEDPYKGIMCHYHFRNLKPTTCLIDTLFQWIEHFKKVLGMDSAGNAVPDAVDSGLNNRVTNLENFRNDLEMMIIILKRSMGDDNLEEYIKNVAAKVVDMNIPEIMDRIDITNIINQLNTNQTFISNIVNNTVIQDNFKLPDYLKDFNDMFNEVVNAADEKTISFIQDVHMNINSITTDDLFVYNLFIYDSSIPSSDGRRNIKELLPFRINSNNSIVRLAEAGPSYSEAAATSKVLGCVDLGYYTATGKQNVGVYSFVAGANNRNSGQYSTVFGMNNTNTGNRSTVFSGYNNNSGMYGCVMGLYNTNTAANNTVCGKYSANEANGLFVVGNGTSTSARKNALVVTTDNKLIVDGRDVLDEMDNTLLKKLNELEAKIAALEATGGGGGSGKTRIFIAIGEVKMFRSAAEFTAWRNSVNAIKINDIAMPPGTIVTNNDFTYMQNVSLRAGPSSQTGISYTGVDGYTLSRAQLPNISYSPGYKAWSFGLKNLLHNQAGSDYSMFTVMNNSYTMPYGSNVSFSGYSDDRFYSGSAPSIRYNNSTASAQASYPASCRATQINYDYNPSAFYLNSGVTQTSISNVPYSANFVTVVFIRKLELEVI